MSPTSNQTCANCRFSIEEWRYEGDGDESFYPEGRLYCRRNPPSVNRSGYLIHADDWRAVGLAERLEVEEDFQALGIFPLVQSKEWCGEWSAR
jgi:hypothetical protein